MADNFRFTNDASALLAGNINDTDLALTVESGKGALFPSLAGSQSFRAALQDANGNLEIVRVTARATDTFTIVRAQEGTTAQSWTLGVTRVELRLTKETMEELLQKNGGTMTGDLNMDENDIVDATISGSATKMTAGQIIGVPLRGAVDDASNEIAVPDDGTRATAGGAAILTAADLVSGGGMNFLPIGTMLMWYASLAGLPTGWQICDGTNGTPDMRGSFPRGAGGSGPALGATGGAATASGSTGSSGGHTHSGSTSSHALTASEIPSHSHGISGTNSSGGAVDENLHGGNMYGIPAVYGAGGSISYRASDSFGNTLTEPVGGSAGHSHSMSLDAVADHTHTLASISTIPPFVGVYFIMKVS